MLVGAAVIAGGVTVFPWPQSPAQIATAEVSPVAHRIAAAGRVEPCSEEIELAVGVMGTLKAVYVAEGDKIEVGQLLAELDNADQQARVAEAEATVRQREAELEKLRVGARHEERRAVAAQLDEAAANLSFAKHEVERRTPLAESGVASRQSIDQTRTTLGAAEAQHAAKEAAVALINAPPRAEDVAIAQANLGLAHADLEEQRALFAKTQLRSPIDGVVLRRYLQSGEVVSIQPPTPILEVGDTRRLRVRAEIDETDIARVAVGQRVSIAADAYPSQRFGGTISRLSQRLGRKTIHTDDPSEKLDAKILEALIDLDAEVRLTVGLRVDVLVEPSSLAADDRIQAADRSGGARAVPLAGDKSQIP
jgi:HlyD family secretion protein